MNTLTTHFKATTGQDVFTAYTCQIRQSVTRTLLLTFSPNFNPALNANQNAHTLSLFVTTVTIIDGFKVTAYHNSEDVEQTVADNFTAIHEWCAKMRDTLPQSAEDKTRTAFWNALELNTDTIEGA